MGPAPPRRPAAGGTENEADRKILMGVDHAVTDHAAESQESRADDADHSVATQHACAGPQRHCPAPARALGELRGEERGDPGDAGGPGALLDLPLPGSGGIGRCRGLPVPWLDTRVSRGDRLHHSHVLGLPPAAPPGRAGAAGDPHGRLGASGPEARGRIREPVRRRRTAPRRVQHRSSHPRLDQDLRGDGRGALPRSRGEGRGLDRRQPGSGWELDQGRLPGHEANLRCLRGRGAGEALDCDRG